MKIKKIGAGIFMCIVLLMLCSAGINDMFVQKKGENGWLFHVFSQKMPSRDEKVKSLEYDYTYLEQTDSVTLLSTIISKTAYTPETATFSYCGTVYSAKTNLVFLKPKGKNYEIRTSTVIPFNVWDSLYLCPNPFSLTYTMKYNNNYIDMTFGYSSGKWKSNSAKLRQIINSVKINTWK